MEGSKICVVCVICGWLIQIRMTLVPFPFCEASERCGKGKESTALRQRRHTRDIASIRGRKAKCEKIRPRTSRGRLAIDTTGESEYRYALEKADNKVGEGEKFLLVRFPADWDMTQRRTKRKRLHSPLG